MSDGKEERVGSPDTNAKTNCSSGAGARISYEGRKKQQQFFIRRPKKTAESMRRSMQTNDKQAHSSLRPAGEKRDIATAGAIDLKIKQDLFAKDIAYEGHSETQLVGKLSEREKARTMQLAAEVISENDESYRRTLEQFNLVKPVGNSGASGDVQIPPGTADVSHSKRPLHQTQQSFQKSSRTVAQTLFAYPDGCASIENVHHESNNFAPRRKRTAAGSLRDKLSYFSFQEKGKDIEKCTD